MANEQLPQNPVNEVTPLNVGVLPNAEPQPELREPQTGGTIIRVQYDAGKVASGETVPVRVLTVRRHLGDAATANAVKLDTDR